MTKTSRYKGLVLGSFLVPEMDMIFGDGVGASLVRGPYCQLGVGLMRFYIGTAQLKKVLRRKSKPISPKVYAQLLNTKTKTQGSRSVKNQWPHSV